MSGRSHLVGHSRTRICLIQGVCLNGIIIANVVFPFLAGCWALKTMFVKPAKVVWSGVGAMYVVHAAVNAYFLVTG